MIWVSELFTNGWRMPACLGAFTHHVDIPLCPKVTNCDESRKFITAKFTFVSNPRHSGSRNRQGKLLSDQTSELTVSNYFTTYFLLEFLWFRFLTSFKEKIGELFGVVELIRFSLFRFEVLLPILSKRFSSLEENNFLPFESFFPFFYPRNEKYIQQSNLCNNALRSFVSRLLIIFHGRNKK